MLDDACIHGRSTVHVRPLRYARDGISDIHILQGTRSLSSLQSPDTHRRPKPECHAPERYSDPSTADGGHPQRQPDT
ncbi:hypothetical protein BO71DRAFT_427579 [Aspergillus ellipticus CBS 707.79]|uniref:Uncharacterized protein n=1 Tax=Aspergillus ellipticus CBS 707.79 TaxID=1448320 RepID=A0A319EYJ1_9EURO|nr:hypothetical protein BO71DRAFT_427579 [Aspergillus ellipticus CBS 707.79]